MNSTILAASGSLLFAGLAIHPFITYPLLLSIIARLRPAPRQHSAPACRTPSVAVCVCAYNEAAVIAGRIENLLALRSSLPNLRILIYVDAATDGTADIVQNYTDSITTVIGDVRMGKTQGMNRLVSIADTDIIVFSDANVMFAPDAIVRLLEPFADPAVGCVCGHLRYTAPHGATAATGSLYWRLEERIKELETATGSVIGADGSIFAIRRALHRPPPPDLIDDMFVSLSIWCGGARIIRAAGALAYETAVSTPREEFRRKIRIACQAFNVHRALWPKIRRLPKFERFKYVSHKLLRWLSVFFFLGSAILLGVAMTLAHAWAWLLAGGVLTTIAITGVLTIEKGPAARLREIAASFIATGLGVLQSIRGEKFQTWTPPASARSPARLLRGDA